MAGKNIVPQNKPYC